VNPEPSELEPLPLSLLNDFLYCPRRAALKIVEGWREANEHTVRGDIVHEHADLPGYEVAKGVTLLRALPVWSERLGLSGKCDIVEVELGSAGGSPAPLGDLPSEISDLSVRQAEYGRKVFGEPPKTARGPRALPAFKTLRPVEYKKGKRRQFENDDAQLCAQALCLEEMFSITIARGAIFHAESKRRREVEFTPELRALTEKAAQELHALLDSQRVPLAVFKLACEECSLYEICLPKATENRDRIARAAGGLFRI